MALIFRKTLAHEPVIKYLGEALARELSAGKRVLWLIPGGSAIAVAVAVSNQLTAKNIPLDKLVVTLTDERFVPVGHDDSNWKQLTDAGFDLPGATLHAVLRGKDMTGTVDDFETTLQQELNQAEYSLGLFGIGSDGHIAGILPHTSAVKETGLAHGYDGGAYQRVTITIPAMFKLDEVIAYAAGEAKWPIFDQLETDLPLDDQPAQILKQVLKATLFNDYK